MANTGYKQATIAYRVDAHTGAPLDISGRLISESGRKQAVMLLAGTSNPDPLKYEVMGVFGAKASVNGAPTFVIDGEACPSGTLTVTPSRIVVSPNGPPVTLTLTSSETWRAAGATFAGLSLLSGGKGEYTIELRPTAVQGQGYIEFTQPRTLEVVKIYVINTDRPDAWILSTGIWDDLAFWTAGGLWNY